MSPAGSQYGECLCAKGFLCLDLINIHNNPVREVDT